MPLAPALLFAAGTVLHGFTPQIGGGDATIDAWAVLIEIDQNGGVRTLEPRRRLAYPNEIAPCASPADLRDAHRADLPAPPPVLSAGNVITRDVVVTALDARGRAICARIYAVILDSGGEHGHPSRQLPFGFVSVTPVPGVVALRVSGWRGLQEKTIRLPR